MRAAGIALAAFAFVAGVSGAIVEVVRMPIDDPAIRYSETPPLDPVSKLAIKIADGSAKLDFASDGTGYLSSLLANLGVSVDSQVLVFSKTSFQSPKISPRTPRAVFFNDTVSVGSVKGGEVYELAALDPKQGVIFYTLNARKTELPKFERRISCLECHQCAANSSVPGFMVFSVFPGADGTPFSFDFTDHRTPLERSFGGWYVTGTHGRARHLGNAVARNPDRPTDLEARATQNQTSLRDKFDASGYLSPVSDIVALMTLEHQSRMTNLMIRAGWDARLGRASGRQGEQAALRLRNEIEELLSYMLFAEEAPLRDPVRGVSTFTKTFAERGPRDAQGRSLRDFDLKTRMFRYRLSYMVYSEAFDQMPDEVRERALRRLFEVLTGRDTSARFAPIEAEERRAIKEILLETKPGLPEYWRE